MTGSATSPVASDSARVLIAHRDDARRDELRAMLTSLGHEIVGSVSTCTEVVDRAGGGRVDVIVSSLRLVDGDGIAALVTVAQEQPVPSVIVTARSDLAAIERALEDHVMAFLVEPVTIDDLRPTIVLVRNRFAQFQELQREVTDLRAALQARKTVEKAKGLLMKQKGLDETAAYRLLQKLASERRRKLVEIAEALLLAQDVNDADGSA